MPAVEGYMDGAGAEWLRKAFGVDAEATETEGTADALRERLVGMRAAHPVSETVVTKRAIPVIGSDDTVEVWMRGK